MTGEESQAQRGRLAQRNNRRSEESQDLNEGLSGGRALSDEISQVPGWQTPAARHTLVKGVGEESVFSSPAAGQHLCQSFVQLSEPCSENLAGHAGQWCLAIAQGENGTASKNQMSWLVAGRAYVIKLSHDKQQRSGVRAKNYSCAVVKCRN